MLSQPRLVTLKVLSQSKLVSKRVLSQHPTGHHAGVISFFWSPPKCYLSLGLVSRVLSQSVAGQPMVNDHSPSLRVTRRVLTQPKTGHPEVLSQSRAVHPVVLTPQKTSHRKVLSQSTPVTWRVLSQFSNWSPGRCKLSSLLDTQWRYLGERLVTPSGVISVITGHRKGVFSA